MIEACRLYAALYIFLGRRDCLLVNDLLDQSLCDCAVKVASYQKVRAWLWKRVPGVITELKVSLGDKVEAGQTILELRQDSAGVGLTTLRINKSERKC